MALSDQWRVQKSTIPAIELANALRGLQKVIGSISPESETISFGGMSYNSLDSGQKIRDIVIDRDFALKDNIFPISPENFDVLVGLAAHEAAHTATDPISGGYHGNDAKAISSEEFIALCEEVYTDNYVRRHFPIQYNYIILARKAYGEKSREGGRTPDFGNINSVSIAKHVYKENIDLKDIPPEHLQAHIYIDSVAGKLAREDMSNGDRQQFYSKSYETIRNMLGTDVAALKQRLTKRKVDDDVPKSMRRRYKQSEETEIQTGVNDLSEESDAEGEGETDPIHSNDDSLSIKAVNERKEHERNAAKMTGAEPSEYEPLGPSVSDKELEELFKEVKENLVSEKEDMSDQLLDLLEDSTSGKHLRQLYGQSLDKRPVTWAKAQTEIMAPSKDHKMLRELDWIKRVKNTLLRQNIRAQAEGTLDKRRLFRHNIDGLTYKKRRVIDKQDLELVLLLDASGSMAPGYHSDSGSIVYGAAHALHTVVPDANVLSYEQSRTVNILNHTWDGSKRMRKIVPSGNTPSGSALLATAMKYPKCLLIHFTDGHSNQDMLPLYAMEVIKEKFPKTQIVNIIVGEIRGYKNLPSNSTAIEMESMEEFPEALKKAIEPWYKTR